MNYSLNHIILSIAASIVFAAFAYGQQQELKEVDSLLKLRKTERAFVILNNIDTVSLDKPSNAEYYFQLGKAESLINQADRSFRFWMLARKKFRALDSLKKVARINLFLAETLSSTDVAALDPQPFINEYLAYAIDQDDPQLLSQAYMQLGAIYIDAEPKKTLFYFKKGLQENKKTGDSLMTAKLHHNLGVVYAEKVNKPDSALYHYNIALQEYEKRNLTDYISYIYNNRASVFKKQGDYGKAIQNYLLADSLDVKEYRKENKRLLYGYIADAYEKNEDAGNALKYLKLQNVYRDSIQQEEQNKAMLDIQTKYEVEKKENENLRLKQNRIYLWVIVGILIAALLIGYLFYRNLREKKKVRDREFEIQQQKLDKVLKAQELAGIDAMIEGQEKERQRIANDLHDNLGSLLATIRLHFQNLKVKKDRLKEEEDRIMKQTDDLIDEAYQQVRTIAHAKNAGVPAKEGLVPAVKNFARKVSASDKIVIEVVDQEMSDRLENSMEIAIFRIIQELITNIIKHSGATEAAIYLTDHSASINILVEDNGRGFDPEKIQPKEGMGLNSIRKRVEYMDGEMDVDAAEGKGTTINIHIPVK